MPRMTSAEQRQAKRDKAMRELEEAVAAGKLTIRQRTPEEMAADPPKNRNVKAQKAKERNLVGYPSWG